MNGAIYVQKTDPTGVLTAGWVAEKHNGKFLTKPLGPDEDELTEDMEEALVFDLNNHCDCINAYLDAGWYVRTANNRIYSPTEKKPNGLSIA